ncbi:MAG: methylated-DNA--[protein]-cysteine S-methyltransferase [Gemmatimonadaceae bacterium]
MTSFALFDTPIGVCGIVWGAEGILATRLPEESVQATRTRLLRSYPNASEAAPPQVIASVIEEVGALLRGEPRDLATAPLDMRSVTDFNRRVYELARRVLPGRTATYGTIATQLGDATQARVVGQALGKNPFPIIVPCHRILGTNGRLVGFSANGGVETKRRMLVIEGAITDLFM